jgi:flavodoxin
MKTCILYFSRTGNTKRMAEAIAESAKAPAFDIASSEPSIVENCDLLILGTPVEGSRPARETSAFIERLPKVPGKKAILFCTHRIWKGSTLKTMEKALAGRGYDVVLSVSKKMKPNQQADFSDELYEIRKVLEK